MTHHQPEEPPEKELETHTEVITPASTNNKESFLRTAKPRCKHKTTGYFCGQKIQLSLF